MEITKDEYFSLKLAQSTLSRLEAGGVDNWEWYGESLNPEGEESFDDLEKRLRKEILG